MYLALAVSNVTCVFSNYQGFDQLELPTTLKVYDASRFAALPYNVSNAETMRTMVKDAILKRIGYLYVSDAKPPNQWGKLPAYWEDEVGRGVPLRASAHVEPATVSSRSAHGPRGVIDIPGWPATERQ